VHWPFKIGTVLALLLLVLQQYGYAQTDIDRQLAQNYFQEGDYKKALIYYQNFYQENPNLGNALPYFKCLVALESYRDAEKLIKKEMRKHPQNLVLGIELGLMYKQSGDLKKAEKSWDEVVSLVPATQNDITRIARRFAAIPQYEYALKVYEKGKRELNNFYAFNFEIADIYGVMGQQEKMIDMYLEMLSVNAGYMQTVQNLLNRNIDFDDDIETMELLRTRLLKFIQQKPDEPLYAELLIWLYIQQRDFYGALAQVKALDRRMQEDGSRVLGLAEMAEGNQFYDVAANGYAYVEKKGKDNPYYLVAKQSGLRTQGLALANDTATQRADYMALSESYAAFFQDAEYDPRLVMVTKREWALLLGQQLGKVDTSLILLYSIINHPATTDQFKAECQIDAGDMLVVNNQIWDAALEYLKAEKSFKYDDIGERAKFKAAKVYYYSGEFGYAKGMLDVLKGSTSRLIANDALYLAQLITDNTTIDTSEAAMQLFAKADLYVNQHRYDDAAIVLDSILTEFPGHRLTDDIYFMQYQIAMKNLRYRDAEQYLNNILTGHATDILGDDAAFLLGVLYDERLRDAETAMSYYEQVLTDFPGSLHVVEARKRFRTLRGDQLP